MNTGLLLILVAMILLWISSTWLDMYRPSRRQLLKTFEALKDHAATERSIASNSIYNPEDRRAAERAAEVCESKMQYMLRTGRLPP